MMLLLCSTVAYRYSMLSLRLAQKHGCTVYGQTRASRLERNPGFRRIKQGGKLRFFLRTTSPELCRMSRLGDSLSRFATDVHSSTLYVYRNTSIHTKGPIRCQMTRKKFVRPIVRGQEVEPGLFGTQYGTLLYCCVALNFHVEANKRRRRMGETVAT